MKYLYSLILTTTLVLLQFLSAISAEVTGGVQDESVRLANYREIVRRVSVPRSPNLKSDDAPHIQVTEKPYGLHYHATKNTWTLYAKVLQLKNTSVYGRPGEIAQIEYSLDGERSRYAWIVVRIDDFAFSDASNSVIDKGRNIQLYVSGAYASPDGVDWEKCPKNDTYCMNAGFIEGGFPKSQDYDGLALCPSNTIIRSGYAPDDWINGMLAWKIRVLPNS